MRRQMLGIIGLAATGLSPLPLAAQDAAPPAAAAPAAQTPLDTRAGEVVAFLNAKVEPADLFSKRFLAAVPEAQLKNLAASWNAQFGQALSAALVTPHDATRAKLEVRYERGIAKGTIAIDPAEDNRVSTLLFTAIEPIVVEGDTPAKVAADLAALPGVTNAWFAPLDGGMPLVSLNADKPLALGSAFKLYVLAALAEDVKAGKRQWTDIVPLSAKSFPSGQLQTWPKGAPLTLHTLASLMISISDNTATDQLIAVLGKDRILKAMKDSGHADPARNTPFLTTRELFIIKASDNQRIAGWRKSDAANRAAILTAVDSEERTLEQVTAAFAGGPKALDIEWFASPADLAKLFAFMRRTADPKAFDILAINPAASDAIKAKWRYVGFKGGSEPGVVNLTWLLTDEQGKDWVLTAAWNNDAAAVEDGKFLALAQRLLLLPR